ncbi:MAG: hypothetical protein IPG55_09620 [Saprospiraceae bacterium]|nr:hypothetical protein [Candidatus Defluviibacterium haderslevense]MBK7243324.1 hypothetical protein [Candidatus Defluviibacterium haderslevense]
MYLILCDPDGRNMEHYCCLLHATFVVHSLEALSCFIPTKSSEIGRSSSQSSSSGSTSSTIKVSNPNSVLTNSKSSACLSGSPAFSVPDNSRLLSTLLSTKPTILQAIFFVAYLCKTIF